MTTLYDVDGWEARTIDFAKITALTFGAVTTYSDMAGMVAATFVKGNEAVISFRGTENQWDDRTTDVFLSNFADSQIPQQVYAAYYYTQAAIASLPVGTKITFTGHSLGGGLASIMARYFGGEAVVFDPAPNRGTALNLADGGPALFTPFPAIPVSSAPPSHVRLYQSELCPVSYATGSDGGGRLGDSLGPASDMHILALTADKSFFAYTKGIVSFLTTLTTKSWDLHSINLVTLQMLANASATGPFHTNDLGTISAKLPDLMTYLTLGEGHDFESVNLAHLIGRLRYGMADEAHRYDLFLRAMVDDKLPDEISGIGANTVRGNIFDNWLADLNAIAGNVGGMTRTDPATGKDSRDWLAQQALIMAAISGAAYQAATAPGAGKRYVQVTGGVTYADLATLRRDSRVPQLGAVKAMANIVSIDAYNGAATGRSPQVRDFRYPDLVPVLTTVDRTAYADSLYADSLRDSGIDLLAVGAATGTDVLQGSVGNDFLYGRGANDTLNGGANGVDWYYGGEGVDTVDFTARSTGVFLNMLEASLAYKILHPHTEPDWHEITAKGIGFTGAVHDSVENVVGSAFDDVLTGHTKNNVFKGGAGNDQLDGGGGYDLLYGDAGNDSLAGGGAGEAHLWGGAGADEFHLSNKTFVEDAEYSDRVYWYGIRLTGGVSQWWSESGWAYWAPVSSLMMPSTTSILGGLVFAADVKKALSFRYGFSASGQLIVQTALGLGGQAVIQNYDLDLETGQGSGGIVAFRQTIGPGSLAALTQYLNLALKAGGFGGFMGQDPLVLDLDGDGAELTREDSSKVFFEFDTDGFAERAGWVKGDDGFLARDLNGNGKIDNAGELFGTATTSGFTLLKTLDSNADNQITSADTGFASLRIWRDLNQNGVTDAGELKTLSASGISKISLVTKAADPAVIAGNPIAAEALFTRTDGTTSKIVEAQLLVNDLATKYLGTSTVSTAATALPQLKGYGRLADLRVAMTTNATLLSQVTSFKALTLATPASMLSIAEQILYTWAGVSAVTPVAMGTGFDTRKLAFLEMFNGRAMAPRVSGQPTTVNVAQLISDWNNVLRMTAAKLAVQTVLGGTTGASFVLDPDVIQSSAGDTLSKIMRAVISSLPTTAAEAQTRWNQWVPLLQGVIASTNRMNNVMASDDYAFAALTGALVGITSPLSLAALSTPFTFAGLHLGTTGADTLTRTGSGKEIYFGGSGNDTLIGGNGQDVYVFDRSFGQDTIIDVEGGGKVSGDRIRFSSLRSDQVTLSRSGSDLLIRVNGATDSVTVKNYYQKVISFFDWQISPDTRVEDIQFADGVILESGEIARAVGRGTAAGETLQGSDLADYLDGAGGNDLLLGGDQGDVYIFNRGNGSDVISDVMTNPMTAANDMLIFGDTINSTDVELSRIKGTDDLVINVRGTTDQVTVRGNFFMTALGWDTNFSLDNRIETFVFNGDGAGWSWQQLQQNLISSQTTSGDDNVVGFGSDDVFESSAGNDYLSGGNGGDVYRVARGTGFDIIQDNMSYITIEGTDSIEFASDITLNDVEFSRDGRSTDLIIKIKNTGDRIVVRGQFDVANTWVFGLVWFNRIENFKFSNGTTLGWQDVLARVTQGTSGRDRLLGSYSPDTLDGKEGSDYLSGGNDGDTYIFGRGYGYDTIDDAAYNVLTQNPDTVRFGPNIKASDLKFMRMPGTDNLMVEIVGTADRLEIIGQFSQSETVIFGSVSFNRIENFVFADGSSLDWTAVQRRMLIDSGTAGNNSISGFKQDDRIDGGAGNDALYGLEGADTYVFKAGSGNDLISDICMHVWLNGADTIELGAGFTSSNIGLLRRGDDMFITFSGYADSVFVPGQYFDQRFYLVGIDILKFSDGSQWDRRRIQQELLKGTSGNNFLTGFNTDDRLDGGLGNDYMEGGWGSDTYAFAAGYGRDVIFDFDSGASGNTIELGSAFTTVNINLRRYASDVYVTFNGSTDMLTLKEQYGWSAGISSIKFSTGTIWNAANIQTQLLKSTAGNDVLTGFGTDDRMDGGAGNDFLYGQKGADTYVFGAGYGNDYIYDDSGDGATDTIELGSVFTISNINLSRRENDLFMTFSGRQEGLTISSFFAGWGGIEALKFSTGTVWGVTDVLAKLNVSGAANDRITGSNRSADTLAGGAGDDYLVGGYGADTYLFNAGDGNDIIDENAFHWAFMDSQVDTLKLGAGFTAANIRMTTAYNGADIYVTFAGRAESIFISQGLYFGSIENIAFSDGTVWGSAQISACLAKVDVNNQTLGGTSGADVLDGAAGIDFVSGGSGDDTYIFNAGSDFDIISEAGNGGGANDILKLGSVFTQANTRLTRQFDDLLVTFSGRTEHILLSGQLANFGVELIKFADGTQWNMATVRQKLLAGTTGNDTLTGFSTADRLDGGAGNDSLSGAGGSDTYVFKDGYGFDIINENGFGWDGVDTLEIGGLLNQTNIQLIRQGNDLLVTFGGTGRTERILLTNQLSDFGTDYIKFGDGTQWDMAMVRQKLLTSTVGNDTLTGFSTADRLDGGAGNDQLTGCGGSDTYVFKDGYGFDIINEDGFGWDGVDTLEIGGLLNQTNIQLTRQGVGSSQTNDLLITFAGRTEQIVLVNQLNNFGIENIKFADGTIWTMANVGARLLQGAAGNDTLIGFYTADRLDGGAGNDQLYGDGGGDTYVFKDGYGFDIISENGFGWDGIDTLEMGGLLNKTNTVLTCQGDDVLITFTGRTEHVVLSAQARDWGIEAIKFADGTLWDATEMRRRLMRPTSGNDTILGFNASDDRLDGGLGNDSLNGGWGSDTYVFGANYGLDVVKDSGFYWTGEDTIEFGSVFTKSNIQLVQDGNDLIVSFVGRDERLVIQGQFDPNTQIEWFRFADGTKWNVTDIRAQVMQPTASDDVLRGFASDDRMDGGLGNDLLYGGEGNDTYVFGVGYGTDTIIEQGWDDNDQVEISAGLTPAMAQLRRFYNDLYVTFTGRTEQLIIKDQIEGNTPVESIRFLSDGTVWSDSAIRSMLTQSTASNDVIEGFKTSDNLSGGLGNDQLFGADGNDVLTGGAGNDYLDGGTGTDFAVFSGVRSSYTLTTSNGGVTFVDNDPVADGNDGIDTLVSIETATFKDQSISLASPIIFDLDGNGVHLVKLKDSNARIDFDNDGKADQTGWFERGDGILVYDRDGNGQVTDASELTFINEKPGVLGDLAGLSTLDSNGDSRLDANDPVFGKLLIWKDRNGDGSARSRELLSLSAAGIASINLIGQATNSSWKQDENVVLNTGNFTRRDGTAGSFSDVALQYASSRLTQAMASFGAGNSVTTGVLQTGRFSLGNEILVKPFDDKRVSA